MKNKPVSNDFDSIQTNHMTIRRVKIVNYLGLDENFYWNAHGDFLCASLVKWFCIFNHIKSFITSRIAWQLYFAIINSRISCDIELYLYGHCADKQLSKLQTLQNILLKLMLKLDRRTFTNQLQRNLSLLKVSDIHTVSVLCFVNNCKAARCPETLCNYYQVQQTERELCNKDHLDVPWAKTDMVLAHVTLKEPDYGMHRENSPVTQTTPEPTLLSWGGWPREKIFPHPWPRGKPGLIELIGHSDPIVLKPFDLA